MQKTIVDVFFLNTVYTTEVRYLMTFPSSCKQSTRCDQDVRRTSNFEMLSLGNILQLCRERRFYTTLWLKKNAPTLADYNYDPVQSILIIFSKLFVNDHNSCLVVKFSTCVATIPCETQCSILH